ncbi:hypothetical protein [Fodinibius sediminis]|nr:hypothetical protein [Fodinibius sediminis]
MDLLEQPMGRRLEKYVTGIPGWIIRNILYQVELQKAVEGKN